jgi:hypothetical protein
MEAPQVRLIVARHAAKQVPGTGKETNKSRQGRLTKFVNPREVASFIPMAIPGSEIFGLIR